MDARNAHLRTSLQLHAARVAKRASEGQQETGKLSAQERMMAIRRRVAGRMKQNQEERTAPRASEGQSDHLERTGGVQEANSEGKDEHYVSGKPETGDVRVKEDTLRRNELLKIHHLARAEDARRIHDPACEASGANAEGERRSDSETATVHDAETCGGRAGMPSDTANAASRAAWHGIEAAVVKLP